MTIRLGWHIIDFCFYQKIDLLKLSIIILNFQILRSAGFWMHSDKYALSLFVTALVGVQRAFFSWIRFASSWRSFSAARTSLCDRTRNTVFYVLLDRCLSWMIEWGACHTEPHAKRKTVECTQNAKTRKAVQSAEFEIDIKTIDVSMIWTAPQQKWKKI